MDKDEILKVLNESLAMEEKGYKFYKEGADKIRNSLGKRMLDRLAADELIHIKRIKEIYNHLMNETTDEIELPVDSLEHFDEIFNRMHQHIREAVDDLTEVGVDDEEIINIALELESHAKFYYQDAASKTTDPKIKEFYQRLATEETNHYELLRKTNSYLENPALFFGMGYH